MRSFATVLALMMLLAVNAYALTGETVPLRDGPNGEGRNLAPVWTMRCPHVARLVGIRVREDRQIVSVQAICAELSQSRTGVKWLTAALIVPPPAPIQRTEPRVVDSERQEGTILRASSSGIVRFRGSRALIVSVGRPKTSPAESSPNDPVSFRSEGQARDLLCATGHYVAGLRTAVQRNRRDDRLVALQLICADGSAKGRERVGTWLEGDQPAKSRPRRTEPRLTTALIECGQAQENPHDGAAVQALYGTVENGRVQTIGISCARTIAGADGRSTLFAAISGLASQGLRAMKWRSIYDEPRWLDGRALAACASRSGTGRVCNQESADRFCTERKGYAQAIAWSVGPFATSSVGVSGEDCERRSCRAFARITCGF